MDRRVLGILLSPILGAGIYGYTSAISSFLMFSTTSAPYKTQKIKGIFIQAEGMSWKRKAYVM